MNSEDVGLANERTALSWQRTALSIVVGSALVARVGGSDWLDVRLILLVVSFFLGGWVFWESRGRYAHTANIRSRLRERSGRAPGALTAAVVLICVAELLVTAA